MGSRPLSLFSVFLNNFLGCKKTFLYGALLHLVMLFLCVYLYDGILMQNYGRDKGVGRVLVSRKYVGRRLSDACNAKDPIGCPRVADHQLETRPPLLAFSKQALVTPEAGHVR